VEAMTVGTTEIRVVCDDLTTMAVDAIVNAANESLRHGGGLAAAISQAGGEVIDRESAAWIDEHGPLTPGTAAVTSAGAMPAGRVIHVAGPRYCPHQDNAGLLRAAVRAALETARDLDCRSIALPAISAGIFGYPMAEATALIAAEVVTWAGEHAMPALIDLVGFDGRSVRALEEGLAAAID